MTGTLRLVFAQLQGGGLPLYHLGAQLLAWLARAATGPVVTIDVPPPVIDRGRRRTPMRGCWRS